MRKKSKPSRSHVGHDIWSEQEINETSKGEDHSKQFESASIADPDNPGVISVASTSKESEVKNHNAGWTGPGQQQGMGHAMAAPGYATMQK